MTPSLCLELFFTDRPFVARMEAAARLGYPAVEFWGWRDKDLGAVGRAAADLGLEIATFSGNRRFGLTDPAQRAALLEELARAIEAAGRLGCRRLMLLADPLQPDGRAAPCRAPAATRRASVREGLAAAAELAAAGGVTLLLEPLNTRVDHPGYWLDGSARAFELVRTVGRASARVLYDVYHMAVMGEDVVAALEGGAPWLGYVHVADAPGRHEPGTGRIDFPRVLAALARLGYSGPVGLECAPAGSSADAARSWLALLARPEGVPAGDPPVIRRGSASGGAAVGRARRRARVAPSASLALARRRRPTGPSRERGREARRDDGCRPVVWRRRERAAS